MTDDPRYPPSIWAMRYSNGVVGARDRLEPYSPLSHGDPFVEYLRADLARARVAAAYEDAARAVMCGCAEASSEAIQSAVTGTDFARACPNLGINCAMRDAAAIVALTPADDRAALDRLLAEARAQEREAAWNIPDIELAAILLAYDEAPGCEETFETWRKQWRSRLGQPHDDDTALMDWLGMAQRLAPMVRAAIRARGAAQEGEDSVNEDDAEYLRADLDRAQVAAAYEAAAEMLIDLGHVSESGETLAQEVRALVPDDARAALDRLLDEARAQERDACAKIADFYVNRLLSDDSYEAGRSDGASVIARAIRARGEAATSQGGGE